MIYTQLFDRLGSGKVVRAGVVGTGQFGAAVVTQSRAISRLEVPVVADVNLDAARQAYRRAGFSSQEIAVCESHAMALHAMERGQRVIVPDALLLMQLPVDLIVEATGVPEAGAANALAAIRHGKHVAMVNKETDVTVGPMLRQLADQAGVVYTAVDGDQHGLLIGLVAWAQELGLEVLSGGKFRDGELVFDPVAGTVSWYGETRSLTPEEARVFRPMQAGQAAHCVEGRRAVLRGLGQMCGFDLVELAIAANATGLRPDVEELHSPALRALEIPEALCPLEEGGILRHRGAIDGVTCLRGRYEIGMGGGVFVVVACENDYSRHILATKGLVANSQGSALLIYRPHHLCGVETAISILSAVLLGVPTGATHYSPRVDVVARATRDLKAGEVVGDDHSPDWQVLMRSAQPVGDGVPIPLHMANGNALAVDVPRGTLLSAEMVVRPPNSALWWLRDEQDQRFLRQPRSNAEA